MQPYKGFGHNVLKLRYYEKATKFEKKFYRFWQNIFFYSVESKQVGDFFNFWGLFRKAGLYLKVVEEASKMATLMIREMLDRRWNFNNQANPAMLDCHVISSEK